MLFGPIEPTAHLAIIAEVNSAIDEEREARYFVLEKQLQAFAPRCVCGNVLKFGPWRLGARMVMCRRGVTFWEARL